ncbi:MAG: hypothetical protein IPJ59_36015 [Nannocystis sp.]|nr:hypothetical protein [Nannocystis sp.]MBK7830548.1 hypothetical protein [Nannocystis sp.]
MGLLRFRSTNSDGKLVSLADYVAGMPEGQDAIFYITGESQEAVARSRTWRPALARGYQVLFLTDPIDGGSSRTSPNTRTSRCARSPRATSTSPRSPRTSRTTARPTSAPPRGSAAPCSARRSGRPRQQTPA